MKHLFLFLFSFLMLVFPFSSFGNKSQNQSAPENKQRLLSSPRIYPLTKEWIQKYENHKPGQKIDAGILEANHSETGNNLYFLTESDPMLRKDSLWKMVIGREAIVPVINSKNPFLDKIIRNGINSRKFKQLFTQEKPRWGTLLEEEQDTPVRLFISGDSLILSKLADFSQVSPSVIKDKVTFVKDPDLATLHENVTAIEFCRVSDLISRTGNQFIAGIVILPVDKNQNNRIDNFEKIYATPESFTRGVWIGKYPHDLCGNIYVAASSRPTDKNTLELLTWIQKGGQDLLGSEGYSTLASTERNSNINELNSYRLLTARQGNIHIWRIIIGTLLIVSICIAYFLTLRRKQKTILFRGNKKLNSVMNENSLLAPKGLFFDKSHTWAFMEQEGMVKIGIDDFLQHITGELTHVILKEPGTEIRKGEKIMTISHTGKKLAIHAPLSGTIRERNRNLLFDPTLINSSPYKEGWIYVIEPKNWIKENHFLFMWEKYLEWLPDELTRLKDFFTSKIPTLYPATQPVLQDGGEIIDNVLSDLGPEVWEDFQEKFIDRSR